MAAEALKDALAKCLPVLKDAAAKCLPATGKCLSDVQLACLNMPAPACVKPPLSNGAKCAISTLLVGSDDPSAMTAVGECDPNRYIVAFCGSGTGHLTQAMKVVEMLNERGMVLAGVVTDSDAPEVMLNELITPLGVPLLVIPAIELVDTQKGFIPLINPCRFISSIAASQRYMLDERAKVAAFFSAARAGKIFNMFHLTLARYFQLNPLPPQVQLLSSYRVPPRLLTSSSDVCPFACLASYLAADGDHPHGCTVWARRPAARGHAQLHRGRHQGHQVRESHRPSDLATTRTPAVPL